MDVRSAARAAAFGPTPDRIPRTVCDPEERWLVAVALGGQGHYAAAAAELARLAADPAVPLRLAAHASVTRAAHLRQLGGHAAARPYDARGLRLAAAAIGPAQPIGGRGPCCGSVAGGGPCCDGAGPADDGLGAAAARLDALVGLAADAVGLGDPATAERLLAVAAPGLAAHPSWRPATRAGWVLAELALVRGRAAEGVASAEAALDAARRGGSLRHVLKSRIVLAVVRATAGEQSPIAAVAELDAAAEECARAGLLPLCWPAGMAALDLVANAQIRLNEQVASVAGTAPGGRSDGTTRRRHAVSAALSVLEQRCDAVGKRQMGESVWIPRSATLV